MSIRSLASVALAALVLAGGSATRAADTTTDTAQTDTRLRVVFFPIAGAAAPALSDVGQKALGTVVSGLNTANALYFACLQSAAATPPAGASACDASRANIIVSTTLRKNGTDKLSLVVNSVDLAGHRTLGSIQKDVAVTTNDDGTIDTTVTGKALAKALKLTDPEIRSLIGTPVVRDGLLSTEPGFQPFIQLVADVSSSDPTYIGVLQNLLAKRGIASVPSQFNAGTVTSGNVGADALCGLGQRYLVYSIAKRMEDRILSLNTRIETRATGHLYDCPTRSDLAFGDTARTFATNTKQSLGPMLTLLGSLFVSKNSSWTNATTTAGLVTAVVDVVPEKIQEHTAEITLQKLVDNFCDRLGALPTAPPAPAVVQQTIPTPKPTPIPTAIPTATPKPTATPHGFLPTPRAIGTPQPPTNNGTPAPRAAGTSGATSTPDTAVPLDIGNFLSSTPPPLKCGDPVYRNMPTIPPNASLFNRRP